MVDIDKVVKLLGERPAVIFPGKTPTIVFDDEIWPLEDYLLKLASNKIEYDAFLSLFILIATTQYKRYPKQAPKGDDKSRRQFKKLVLAGYILEDFQKAIISMHETPYHIDTRYQYATPEFITRDYNFERFLQTYELLVEDGDIGKMILEMKDIYDKWNPGKTDPESSQYSYHKEKWIIAGNDLRENYKSSADKELFIVKVKQLLDGHPSLDFVVKGLQK